MANLRLRKLTEAEEKTLILLDTQTKEQLYTLVAQNLGILEKDESSETAWYRWLNSRKDQLYELICVQGDYCKFVHENGNAEKMEIFAAVGDLIASVFGALPVFTVATLLVKYVLDDLCGCNKE